MIAIDTTSLSFTDGGSGLHSTKEPLVKESDVGDFFDTIESEVQSEMKKEKQKKQLKDQNSTVIVYLCNNIHIVVFRLLMVKNASQQNCSTFVLPSFRMI